MIFYCCKCTSFLYNGDYKTTYNELPQALPEKPNWESKFDSADKEMDARLKK